MHLAAAIGPAPQSRALWLDVDGSERLLAEHLSAAVRRFGTAVLGLVDLPAIEHARPSRAELGVAAVLMWARHVDEAGLLDLVDALADGVVRGTLPLPIQGEAVRKLMLWRRRHDKFAAEERRALYERVIGELDARLADFIEVLVDIGHAGRHDSIRHLQVRAGVIGHELAGELTARATGIAAFAARDIVQQVRDALAVLTDVDLVQALGGGSPWTLVSRHAPTLLRRPVNTTHAVARAMAGRELIEWLGRNADRLVAGTVAPTASDPVVRAALAYAAEST
ncbi:MAG TPA: hypothetical protein VM261_16160 [Kofleriaceae bacterium]|nr:hypothetical protein [Kofleriaceae bacterium]